MFTRRKANKSGSYSIQVVRKINGHYQLVRSFGASKDEEELSRLEIMAAEFIAHYGGQQTLEFTDKENEAVETEALLRSISSIVLCLSGRDFWKKGGGGVGGNDIFCIFVWLELVAGLAGMSIGIVLS